MIEATLIDRMIILDIVNPLHIRRSVISGLLTILILSGCSTSDRFSTAVDHSAPALSQVSPQSEVMFEVLAAELAGRRGMLDVAADNYLSAAQKTNDSRLAERATKLAVYGQTWSKAEIAAKRWIDLTPENLEARQLLAQVRLNQGKIKGATEALVGLIEFSDNFDLGIRSAVAVLLRDTNRRVAADVITNITTLYPESHLALFAQARLLLIDNQKEEALLAAEDSLTKNSDFEEAILLKGQILLALGRASVGYEYIRSRIAENPDSLELRLGLARLLVDAEQYDQASKAFEHIADLASNNPNALYSLGLLAIESRRTALAEKYLQRVIELGAYLNDAHFFLGRIAENKQEYTEALIHYEHIQEGENMLDAQIRAAEIYATTGQLEKGINRLQQLRTLTADSQLQIRLILSEGRILREAGVHKESLAVFNSGLKTYPKNVELLYAHALTAEQLDMNEVFESDLRKVIELEPDNAHALNALGYFLVERSLRLEEAEKYLTKANNLLPGDPAITDSLGWLNYRKGNYTQAISLLRKAFDKLADPEIAAHLGEVLWVTGDQKSATDIWQQGLENKPDDGLLKGVMERYIQ